MGNVFHSTSLIGDPNFLDLQNYVGATSQNLLNEMGFDLSTPGSGWGLVGDPVEPQNIGAKIQ